jgi:hypothetical protein
MATSSRDLLTEYQQQILNSFQEITNYRDDQLSIEMLSENNWSLEAAVNNFMLGGSSRAVSHRPSTSPRPPTSASNQTTTSSRSNADTNNSNNRNAPAAAEGSGLLDLILYPLRWLVKSHPLSINPNRDAQNFINDFNSNYGSNHVPFQSTSYQATVAAAFQQTKFVLVYLHSSMHQDTDDFCRQVLNNQAFIDFANESMLVWGGNVWDPEAYGLSSQLGVSAFPFLGLLVPQSARAVQVADRVQGTADVNAIITQLRGVASVFSAVIERNRAEAFQRYFVFLIL